MMQAFGNRNNPKTFTTFFLFGVFNCRNNALNEVTEALWHCLGQEVLQLTTKDMWLQIAEGLNRNGASLIVLICY